MIYLHKILPVFLLPVGLTLLLVVVGALSRKRAPVLLGAAVLAIFSLPATSDILMRLVSAPYQRNPAASMPRADAIVVLGGMLEIVEGAPLGEWNEAADRFEAGIDLFRAHRAPLLIFTGGWIPWKPKHPPEGLLAAKRAELVGVPREAIRVTGKVHNTADEATAIRRLLGSPAGGKVKILLTTSAYHMRRSEMLFRRAGFDVIPFPVDFAFQKDVPFGVMRLLPKADALERSEAALREMLGYAYYRVQGFSEEIRKVFIAPGPFSGGRANKLT